jgi:hypothetical protein
MLKKLKNKKYLTLPHWGKLRKSFLKWIIKGIDILKIQFIILLSKIL